MLFKSINLFTTSHDIQQQTSNKPCTPEEYRKRKKIERCTRGNFGITQQGYATKYYGSTNYELKQMIRITDHLTSFAHKKAHDPNDHEEKYCYFKHLLSEIPQGALLRSECVLSLLFDHLKGESGTEQLRPQRRMQALLRRTYNSYRSLWHHVFP